MNSWRSSDFEKAMKRADASLRAEGLYVTEDENELIWKKLRGEIRIWLLKSNRRKICFFKAVNM